jgi:DNA-binding transcriptional LysR family regulator
MNLFQLRAFDAVAREGSFTRAAERLFISQPAVTGHVKALEEHYQITLLRRTARRVELTEEGTGWRPSPGPCSAWPKKPRRCSRPTASC